MIYCHCIFLLPDNLQIPQSKEEWLAVAKGYEEKWNFPQCIGAIDGKHIQLQAPIHSGSQYFNYKSTFSIVLMAVVDADYNFLFADVGCQGRISDGGVIKNTEFYKSLENKTLMIPEPTYLKNSENKMPYVFVADEAFQLKDNIMKPFSGVQQKGSIQRSFNYRLSRARRVVENVFGILSTVFRVLRKPILLEPNNAELVVFTCIYLHIFLRKQEITNGCFSYDVEKDGNINEGTWRQDNIDMGSFTSLSRVGRKPTRTAEEIRLEFAKYFFSERLPWQDNYE